MKFSVTDSRRICIPARDLGPPTTFGMCRFCQRTLRTVEAFGNLTCAMGQTSLYVHTPTHL